MTSGGYSFTEAWNLQLQHRVRNLEQVLSNLIHLIETEGSLHAYKGDITEAKEILLGQSDEAQKELQDLLKESEQ